MRHEDNRRHGQTILLGGPAEPLLKTTFTDPPLSGKITRVEQEYLRR